MNIKDFSQPTILSGKQYGTTVTIELDHSDTSIDEVMDGMLTIVKGLGYLDSTINEWIKDKSKDIYDDEYDIISKSLADDWFDEEDETDEGIDWDEERIDIIGQNGNEGTHYGLATDDDIEECELNEHSELNDKPHYDWDGEDYEEQFKDWERETPTDEDEDEFDDYGMRKIPNEKLKDAAQRYSDEVRAKHTPIKEQKVLGEWQTKNKNKKIVPVVRKGKINDLKK